MMQGPNRPVKPGEIQASWGNTGTCFYRLCVISPASAKSWTKL